MVFFKISLGQELRKLAVEKESIDLESLKTMIKDLFPSLADINELYLLYHDNDDDLITVSSDQELDTALTELGDSDTLRVMVVLPPPVKQEKEEATMEYATLGDLFHYLLENNPFHLHHINAPFYGCHHTSWFERQYALRLLEEKICQQRVYEEKMRKARMEQLVALREKAQELNKVAGKETKAQEEDGNNVVIPEFPPGWKVNTFGSQDPVESKGPNFVRRRWGPYGYVAYLMPSSSEEKETEDDEIFCKGTAKVSE